MQASAELPMTSWILMAPLLRSGSRRLSLARAAVTAALVIGSRLPAAEFDSWQKVENAEETRDYGQQLREGKFEGPQQRFLSGILLPQLALPANRMIIGQVRQRIREIATQGASQPPIFEGSNALVLNSMVRTARDAGADPLTRVNAILLVGELQGADRKPWKGAVQSLAVAAADAKLPLEVRIAALAGLARHASAGDDAFAAQAGPALAAIIGSPPDGDPAAVSWLLARAVDLLPAAQPAAAATAALARIAADDGADLDLRIRASSALAKVATRGASGDPAALIGMIRPLAIAGLQRDLAAAEARRFTRQVTAGGSVPGNTLFDERGFPAGEGIFGGPAGGSGLVAIDEDAVPVLACRRNAWRLATLADAVKPESGSGGLGALVEGDAAAAALDLAADLRRASRAILASPDEKILAEALATLSRPAGAAGAAADRPAKEAEDPRPPTSPFDDPGVN